MSSLDTGPPVPPKPPEPDPTASPNPLPDESTSPDSPPTGLPGFSSGVPSPPKPDKPYQYGRYFGIPVGQLADPPKVASSASRPPHIDPEPVEHSVPAQSTESKHNIPVDVMSRWSTSSDLSVPYNVVSYRPRAKTQLPGPSGPARITRGSPMRERFAPENMGQDTQGNQSSRADDMPSDRTKDYYMYPEFPPTATVVMRGGFEHIPKPEEIVPRPPIGVFFRKYPPPSNEDYEYTSDGRDPKFVYHPPTPVVSSKPATIEPPAGTVVQLPIIRSMPCAPMDGDRFRKREQEKWHDRAVRLLGLGLGESATDEERDFIYNEAYNLIEQRNGHCWRCDCVHIEFGPPETLPDRDTCGAYLPGWFPANEYKYPWREFKELWREIIYLEETGRSFEFTVPGVDPQQPMWDREYHHADVKWKELHPEGQGWWNCRNGPDATEVELNCGVCHRIKASTNEDPRLEQYFIRKNALVKWVYGCLKHMGVDDEAAAEGIVLRLGVNRISHYPYFPGNGEKARESRFMPENLRLNMPVYEQDGNNKGKALEVLDSMECPSMLRPRDRDPYPVGQQYPYKYLSGSRERKPRFDVRNLWNEDDEPSTPAELKTYVTTMQENYDPRVDGDEKARDDCERKKLQDAKEMVGEKEMTATASHSKPPPDSSLALGSPELLSETSSGASEAILTVEAPTTDRTKARSGTISDLEAMASGMEGILLHTSPTRMSRLN